MPPSLSPRSFDFNSTCAVEDHESIPGFSQEAVKNEPMFFRSSYAFAHQHGGPITHAFLDALMASDVPLNFNLDTRVHMLKPGWFPCIPGWHHDDIPRSRADGQPDYATPAYHASHCISLVNGDIAPTAFALGQISLPEVLPGQGPVYKHWHEAVDQAVNDGSLATQLIPSNTLVWFGWQSFHQGTRAVRNGWRWMGRATWNTDVPAANEIRRQVQVYLENPMEGW